MHPVLGTMMPKICEAPHLPTSLFQPSFCPAFKEWDAFITFLLRVQENIRIPITVKDRGVDLWAVVKQDVDFSGG